MDLNNRFGRMIPGPASMQAGIAPLRNLSLNVEAINEEVNRVTVRAEAPNPGYGLQVTTIHFTNEQAIIQIAPLRPKPGAMYPQVISSVKTVTYIGSGFTPVFPPEYEAFSSAY